MKRASIIVLVASALAQSFGPLSAAQAAPIDPAAMLAEGKGIAETYCSSCHAVGTDGDSAFKEAPQFRTLGAKYDLENLQEALAEGIAVGHPEMPQFEFSPQASDALIAYLKSIQPKTKAKPKPH